MNMLTALPAAAEEFELLRDPYFKNGFDVNHPIQQQLHRKEPPLQWSASQTTPVWRVAQWHSRFSLTGATSEITNGFARFCDPAKLLIVGTTESTQGILTLAIDSRREWKNKHREATDPWPHLLVEQEFLPSPPIADLASVNLHLEARLLQSERFESANYSSNIHAAQYQLFLIVQNRNKTSPGYGDFLWLGVPIYDDRWEQIPAYCEHDIGTGKLIYSASSERYSTGSVLGGEWVTIQGDLLPLAKKGIETAWKRGYLSDSNHYGDYYFSGMNLGWEVPGINHVSIQIKQLSITVRPSQQ